jgi:hypothetical protein
MNAPPKPVPRRDAAALGGGFPGSALLTDPAAPLPCEPPIPGPANASGFTTDYLPSNRGLK